MKRLFKRTFALVKLITVLSLAGYVLNVTSFGALGQMANSFSAAVMDTEPESEDVLDEDLEPTVSGVIYGSPALSLTGSKLTILYLKTGNEVLDEQTKQALLDMANKLQEGALVTSENDDCIRGVSKLELDIHLAIFDKVFSDCHYSGDLEDVDFKKAMFMYYVHYEE